LNARGWCTRRNGLYAKAITVTKHNYSGLPLLPSRTKRYVIELYVEITIHASSPAQ